jgi:hypothetical protein
MATAAIVLSELRPRLTLGFGTVLQQPEGSPGGQKLPNGRLLGRGFPLVVPVPGKAREMCGRVKRQPGVSRGYQIVIDVIVGSADMALNADLHTNRQPCP